MEFFTADLCDEYDEKLEVLTYGFKSYGRADKFYGKIETILLEDNNKDLKALLNDDGFGRVVVVDVKAKFTAVVGDNLMALAEKNGWVGIVVNGYVRDIENTKKIDVGLLALGTCPKKSPNPKDGKIGIKLTFGGINFKRGDFIYVDVDGVVLSSEPIYT